MDEATAAGKVLRKLCSARRAGNPDRTADLVSNACSLKLKPVFARCCEHARVERQTDNARNVLHPALWTSQDGLVLRPSVQTEPHVLSILTDEPVDGTNDVCSGNIFEKSHQIQIVVPFLKNGIVWFGKKLMQLFPDAGHGICPWSFRA